MTYLLYILNIIWRSNPVQFLIDFINHDAHSIISAKGLSALRNPVQLKRINKSMDEAKENYKKTGVWISPVVDLETNGKH